MSETDKWSLEILSSDEARVFVANLRDQNYLKARARADRDMRRRGYAPVDAPTVVKFKDKNWQPVRGRYGLVARVRDWFLPPLYAQEYYYADDGQGYMVAYPWSDGDSSTFEADTFTQHNDGKYWDIDNQIWIGDGDYDLIWAVGYR
ncbi:MAG: hypothetical protein ACREUU_05450, partial [Gammaproteobacteria bacterium]